MGAYKKRTSPRDWGLREWSRIPRENVWNKSGGVRMNQKRRRKESWAGGPHGQRCRQRHEAAECTWGPAIPFTSLGSKICGKRWYWGGDASQLLDSLEPLHLEYLALGQASSQAPSWAPLGAPRTQQGWVGNQHLKSFLLVLPDKEDFCIITHAIKMLS